LTVHTIHSNSDDLGEVWHEVWRNRTPLGQL
jgi:hypothetical protein